MRNFFRSRKITGYTSYKSNTFEKSCVYAALHAMTYPMMVELQQVTASNKYYLYDLCNFCNLRFLAQVTAEVTLKIKYFQSLIWLVTFVTRVTRQKSDFYFLMLLLLMAKAGNEQ
jgi:hypothetical protein